MNISAINCTPIKPKVSFGDVEHKNFDAEKLHDMATDLNERSVDSKDIKKPIAVVASLAALAGIAYGGGKKIATGANVIYEKVAAAAKPAIKETADDVAQAAKNTNLGVVLEDGLKKASSIASQAISKVRVPASEEITVLTKSQHLRNKSADILEKGLNIAKNAYKKVAYSGIADDIVGAARSQAALENVAGVIGLATVVPEIVARDANDDGVNDIMQKSQNAYTSKEEQIKAAADNLGAVSDIVQMFT